MCLFYDLCQEVVDSKYQTGKMSCGCNVNLIIYFYKEMLWTLNPKLSLSLMVLLEFLVTFAHSGYIFGLIHK